MSRLRTIGHFLVISAQALLVVDAWKAAAGATDSGKE